MTTPYRTVTAAVVGVCRAVVRLLTGARRVRLRHSARAPDHRGSPAADEVAFVGREDLIRRILSTIHSNSILLQGAPGIGKTAVLRELARRLETLEEPAYRFHPVYVDLEGVPERRLFAALADAVLSGLAPGLVGGRSGELCAGGDYGHRDLTSDLRRALDSLGDRHGAQVRIVLLIDRIDTLDSFHPRTAQGLRSLFMTGLSDSIVMVASAVEISRRWEREGSPWYNFFEEIGLDVLPHEDARRMVEAAVTDVMDVEVEAVERILLLSDCHPLRIRRCCRELVEGLREQGRRTITLADVEWVGSTDAA